MDHDEQSPRQEVLPPERKDGQAYPLPDVQYLGRLKVAILDVPRFWSARQVTNAFRLALRAEELLYEQIGATHQANVGRARALVHLEEIEDIREAERLKIKREIEEADLESELRLKRLKAELSQHDRDQVLKEVLGEIEKLGADLKLERLKNPPERAPQRSKLDKELDEIKEARKQYPKIDAWEKELMEEAGVSTPEELSKDDQLALRKMRSLVASER